MVELELKLGALRDAMDAEMRRHLLQLAELHADTAAVKHQLELARARARRDLSKRPEPVTVERTMKAAKTPRPRTPRIRRTSLPTDRPWFGRVTTSTHAFPLALRALVPPVNVKEWAKNHGLDRERVRGWFAVKGKKTARRIPIDWAIVIQNELGLRATEETWPNGINFTSDPTAAPYLIAAP